MRTSIDAHGLQSVGVKLRHTQNFAANRLFFQYAPYTFNMVSSRSAVELPSEAWRELYRCENLVQARAVATCIAAMEFDVRLSSAALSRHSAATGDDEDFPGPYVVEVPMEHWSDLADVLLEIVREQQEFDEMLEMRAHRRQLQVVLILGAAGVVEVLAIWHLLDR